LEEDREFLKTHRWETFRMDETDQQQNVPHPPLQKEYPKDAKLIDLVAPTELIIGKMPLIDVINKRKSHRKHSKAQLTLEELSFLLWSTQGVHEIWRDGGATRRTVPSGGSRHPFVTYLFINRVDGIEPGIYRYLPLEHKLFPMSTEEGLSEKVGVACRNQKFVGKCAVAFIWTAVPYRAEWRYGVVAHKSIILDAGHMCQNLYLASEAINAGTCAIGAYSQDKMDQLIKVDGKDEFTIYAAAVGKIE